MSVFQGRLDPANVSRDPWGDSAKTEREKLRSKIKRLQNQGKIVYLDKDDQVKTTN